MGEFPHHMGDPLEEIPPHTLFEVRSVVPLPLGLQTAKGHVAATEKASATRDLQ